MATEQLNQSNTWNNSVNVKDALSSVVENHTASKTVVGNAINQIIQRK